MEYKFVAPTQDGQTARFILNDINIDYLALRSKLPEDLCIEAIEQVKKRSGKKCAIVFGNCQTLKLRYIFQNHMQFRREYFLLTVPAVCDYKENMVEALYGGGGTFLKLCDLFISQHVKEENRFGSLLSTKNISEKFNENTKIVWIPNVYFKGYFPQFGPNTHNVDTDKQGSGRFPYGDKYIDEIMENSGMNPDVEKILDTISDENFIPPDVIQTAVDKSLNELKRREWNCDVKMSDYVENNFRDQSIFFSPNHPVPPVLIELARRIFKFIGIRSDNFYEFKDMLDERNHNWSLIGLDIPIYPAVKKFCRFEKCLDLYYANAFLWNFRAGFRDFLRQYILMCWHEKFSK